MRTSDRARERTAALLRRRCGEGYLSFDTFERRLEDVYRATTAEELASLSSDLPASGLLGRLRRQRAARDREALRVPLDLAAGGPLILGRSRRCDVLVDHDTVSRRHAAIERGEHGWVVRDLGSSNGTWIDGRRIQLAAVDRGDRLLLGGCLVVLL